MSQYDDDDYSDDFVSGDEDDTRQKSRGGRHATYGKSKAYSKPKGRGRGRGQTQKQSPRLDNVAQRLMSANRIKMNEMRNQFEDQKAVIRNLQEENKLLKKMQYRQGKALEKFEDQESDLPRLILKHNNEVRALRDQLRTAKEKFEKTDRYLRDAEDDLERANAKMKKYRSLAEDKNLPERDDLNRKLSRAELDLEEKDNKIKELQRHVDHLSKNHRHELGVEIARHRETKKQLEEVKDTINNLENKLKEKEKELEIKNIYSNRAMRPPHRLPASYGGTPLDSPPPGNTRRRVPSITEMTAREKAKMFEMKRREDMKKNKPKPKPRPERTDAFENTPNDLEEERNRLVLEEQHRREEENRYLKALEDEERERERQQELMREEERKRKRDRELEDEQMRRERDRLKRESDELQRREAQRKQEQREREEREERERKERERLAREEREKLERERKEREERQQEFERLAREERERQENDPQVLEDRRKKDLLLARLKAIDNGAKENVSPVNRSPFEDDVSVTSSKKSYSFSKPIENLHNGKPAYEEVSVPYIDKRKQQKLKDDDFGGYSPSFSGKSANSNSGFNATSSPSKKSHKKTALMDELFGAQRGQTSKDDDAFFVTSDNRKPNSKRSSGFPWDDESPNKHTANITRHRENSSNIFAGGAALIDEESASDKSKLLPRRTRQHASTFSSKPAVSMVDNFDDDLEEVML